MWALSDNAKDDNSPLIILLPGVSLDLSPPPYIYELIGVFLKKGWSSLLLHYRGTRNIIQVSFVENVFFFF
jgi:predicted alpha/beta-fold hydrolase